MKKIITVTLGFILSIAFTTQIYSQDQRLSTTEWAAQNPDKVQLGDSNPGGNEVTGNSSRELMNGYTYTYVGSFRVSDGPYWGNNPPCYTGQEAAALLFGGNPGDYAISTNPNTTDPNTITFTAWLDGWGEFVMVEYPQDYKLDLLPAGYESPYATGANRSAYVSDHVDFTKVNYVWLAEPEPVPVSDWALGLGILLIVGFAIIRLRRG